MQVPPLTLATSGTADLMVKGSACVDDQADRKKTTVEPKPQVVENNPQNLKPDNSGVLKFLGRAGIKTLKAAKWTLFNLHNILFYGTAVGTALVFTPGGWKGVNNLLQTAGYVPIPAMERSINENKYGYPYDSFVQNFNSFSEIHEAIKDANINPRTLDLNNNGYILDTKEEINELISRLENARRSTSNQSNAYIFEGAISKLRDINHISQLIWGVNGPKADNISQMGEPTCQTMSALKGLFLTDQGTQSTKGTLRVTKYNLTPGKDFHIDTTVRINGTDVDIPFNELTVAQSPAGYTPSQSTDNSLYTGILSLAVKKSSTDSIPNMWPSSSLVLLTGREYSTVPIIVFSDSELDDILSNAPNTLMTVAGNFSLRDINNGLNFRNENWIAPEPSTEKANEFLTKISTQSQLIQNGTPDAKSSGIPTVPVSLPGTVTPNLGEKPASDVRMIAASSFPPSSPSNSPVTTAPVQPPQSTVLDARYVSEGHMYVVEGYDREKGILTISDSHRTKIQLTRNEVREKLIAVVLPNDDFNFFGIKSFAAYGLLTLAGLGYHFGKKKLKTGVLVLMGKKPESKQTS